MMSTSNNNDCFTCSQTKKKSKSSIICVGCHKPFCREHHQEHRKLIEKDFHGLIEQHNLLRQNLDNENIDKNSRLSKLLEMIDQWEKTTIAKIKATAAESKIRLNQVMNEEKDQLKQNFKSISDELKTNQTNSDYVEHDIQQWQRQISECKQKLEELQVDNNNFIDIDIRSVDWDSSINIRKRQNLRIKMAPTSTKIISTRRGQTLKCSYCDKSYHVKTGYNSRFCSEDCETNYDTHNPDSSSSDNGGDGCFHENCLVCLEDGTTKSVKDVRRGDTLMTADGLKGNVTYVVKIRRKNKNRPLIRFDSGLIITPWHPIRVDGKWIFPRDIGTETIVECEEVYNFALDCGHIAIINGIECVTLGHHFKGDVIEHPYYGTDKVLNDLRVLDVFNDGFLELLSGSIVRNNKTGLVSGILKYSGEIEHAQVLTSASIPCSENV